MAYSWIKRTGSSKLRGAVATGEQTLGHRHPGGRKLWCTFPVLAILSTFTLRPEEGFVISLGL